MVRGLLRARARSTAVLAALVVGLSVSGGSPGAQADTAPPTANVPVTVSSDALPTVQIDGVVWTQLVVGNVVYVGGQFTTARPAGAAPGTKTVPRSNFLAYDVRTGALIESFAPAFNAPVRALAVSPDQKTLYVGGQFTTLNGANRYRLAAFDVATGALRTKFNVVSNSSVYGLAATATRVYAVGPFTIINNANRLNAAAVDAVSGAVLPFSVSPAGGQVRQVTVSLDPQRPKVILSGNFTTLNGSANPGYGLAAVNPDTGALLPLAANAVLRNGGPNAGFTSLTATSEGFFGSGYSFQKSAGNVEGAFKVDWDGNLVWLQDCHGDTYSVAVRGNALYVAGHPHYCGGVGGFPETSPRTFHRGLSFSRDARGVLGTDPHGYFNFEGRPAPALLSWFPDINAGSFTGQTQGPWSVAASADYVVYGGEFTEVNGAPQQGLVRFAASSLAPNDDGPSLGGSNLIPTARAFENGTVRVTWPTNLDRDNERLSYRLYRDNTVVFEGAKDTTFWARPTMGFTDRNLVPGQAYRYQLRTSDPHNNVAWSSTVTVNAAASGPRLSGYNSLTLDQGPATYWPFNDTSGSAVPDYAGNDAGAIGTAVVRGVPGALSGESSTAYRLSGALASTVGTTVSTMGPDSFTSELWFKTTSATGGALIGFDSSATGGSTTADRVVYLTNAGRLVFVTKPYTFIRSVKTTQAYNDGKWHHVAATLGGQGMSLYVDGALAGNLPTTKGGRFFRGYWRVGGTVLTALPDQPTSTYVSADVDEVALHNAPLSAAQIAARYQLGSTGAGPNVAPTGAFTASATPLHVEVDGAASTDPDGTVASYAWNFGDGSTGSGANASHDYAAAGTYQVSLVVTDDRGTVSKPVAKQVVVPAPPNVAPVAGLELSTDSLTVSVDGSSSTDPDGSVADYRWDYGDGSIGSGQTDSHTYAVAGSYVVRLTVTDDDGGSASVTRAVSVPVGAEPFVLDAFDRIQSSGLGTADVGGAWTTTGASGFAVDGGVGIFKLSSASVNRAAYLNAAQRDSADVSLVFASDKPATGGGTYLTVSGRRVSAVDDYRTNIRMTNTGKLTVSLGALKGSSTAVALSSTVTLPGTYLPGTDVRVRMQTLGTGSTTVRAKVWLQGESEPSGWTVSAVDSHPSLQASGAVGFAAYLSGSATNAPITVSLGQVGATPVTP